MGNKDDRQLEICVLFLASIPLLLYTVNWLRTQARAGSFHSLPSLVSVFCYYSVSVSAWGHIIMIKNANVYFGFLERVRLKRL